MSWGGAGQKTAFTVQTILSFQLARDSCTGHDEVVHKTKIIYFFARPETLLGKFSL
jgi:hypothetical protein